MTAIDVLGAGAFGTALAISLARDGRDVTLWGRNAKQVDAMRSTGRSSHLDGVELPGNLVLTDSLEDCGATDVLLCMPMQALGGFLSDNRDRFGGKTLVACCKGIDLTTGLGPSGLISEKAPAVKSAVLTGPSFAADIARGLPTALTLACHDPAIAKLLQHDLTTPALRLYRSTDPLGAELGGALKNVIALAAGMVIGRGFGDSARAALMTRGFVEMQRFAAHKGADGATLYGLSGFGDLVLTCTSELSRNFAHGFAVGRGGTLDTKKTVEGIATSHAVAGIARAANLDMPITLMVSAVLDGSLTINEATETLMSRALREE